MSEPELHPAAPNLTCRWYHLTPARLMLALLAAEAFLVLSEQFRWFPLSGRKGWTVLICLATVGAAVFLMMLWFAVTRVFRWRFQFSIRSLLLLVAVVAIASSWLARDLERARRQREIVAAASKLGCGILFDYNLSPSGEIQFFSGATPGRTGLHKLLGDDFFREIAGASPKNDAALELLKDQTSIRKLLINDSQVTDTGLKHIERMKRLEWLDLRDSPHVTDAGLVHLQRLSQLQGLLVRRTGVSDAGMVCLKDLKRLEILDLGMTQVTDDGLKHLAGLIRLRQLSFWANKIEDPGLAHLRGMTQLEILELGFAPVTDAGMENLKGLNQLQTLNLRGSRLTDAGLVYLSALRQLRQLDLYKTHVSNAGLDHLAGLVQLETLNVGATDVSDEGVKKLQRMLPKCKVER